MLPKVLLVEDEPLMHMLYKKHVEKAGYQLVGANSAEEGLAIARAEKPAVIIMDMMLTEMDGLAALRQLQSDQVTKPIPVILITASVSQHHATRKEALASGAAVFMTKPIGPGQLVDEIRRLAPIADN